jgi:hypothetical protein
MIKVNVSRSEYVNVPANNISSWCISSRGTIFTWRADIEQCKVSDVITMAIKKDWKGAVRTGVHIFTAFLFILAFWMLLAIANSLDEDERETKNNFCYWFYYN